MSEIEIIRFFAGDPSGVILSNSGFNWGDPVLLVIEIIVDIYSGTSKLVASSVSEGIVRMSMMVNEAFRVATGGVFEGMVYMVRDPIANRGLGRCF